MAKPMRTQPTFPSFASALAANAARVFSNEPIFASIIFNDTFTSVSRATTLAAVRDRRRISDNSALSRRGCNGSANEAAADDEDEHELNDGVYGEEA
ncbi:MAG TPA: hypothetical protein V6C97_30270 [Oculatellaceae cyanobacterium]